jgi:prepilin-type N-terminal cleavage/methylation domain-containing protein
MKSEGGFTLIELLVVIAILAVLFGLTALMLTGVGDEASAEAAKAEGDIVQTALDICDTISGCTPGSAVGCTQPGPNSSDYGAYLRRTSRFYMGWDSNLTVTGVFAEDDTTCSSTPLWP